MNVNATLNEAIFSSNESSLKERLQRRWMCLHTRARAEHFAVNKCLFNGFVCLVVVPGPKRFFDADVGQEL